MSRRIQRLETALGVKLFEKSSRGYALARGGKELLGLAERMETVAEELHTQASRYGREIAGTIRFSGLVVTMRMYGMPLMEMFRKEYPRVFFEVDTREGFASLEKGEADIAMRSADSIEGDTLVARKIDEQPFALYCSNDYAAKHGFPRSLEESQDHNLLAYAGSLNETNSCIRWMHARMPKDRIIFRVDSPEGMCVALRTGAGVGLLPRVIGEDDPDLTYCCGHRMLKHPIWIVASQEAYATPLVRTFLDYFAKNFRKVKRAFPDEPRENGPNKV